MDKEELSSTRSITSIPSWVTSGAYSTVSSSKVNDQANTSFSRTKLKPESVKKLQEIVEPFKNLNSKRNFQSSPRPNRTDIRTIKTMQLDETTLPGARNLNYFTNLPLASYRSDNDSNFMTNRSNIKNFLRHRSTDSSGRKPLATMHNNTISSVKVANILTDEIENKVTPRFQRMQNTTRRTEKFNINETNQFVSVDDIEKKSLETKKEIEDLKAELQKLINCEFNGHESKHSSQKVERTNEVSDVNAVPTDPVPAKVRKKKPQAVTEIPTPKKERVIHYDPITAREYMRKQKLLRQNKQQEEMKHKLSLQEEKRRKLKELQDKTLKILYNKRQRSPTKRKSETKEPIPNGHSVVDSLKTSQIEVIPTLEARSDVALVTPNCHLRTRPTIEECISAATKIKAVYKGYKQRIKYREMLETKQTEERLQKLYQQRSSSVEKKPNEICSNRMEVIRKQKHEVPSWLQPARALPYPYNFITAVKQKLSLALYGDQYYAKYNSSQFTTDTSRPETIDDARNSLVVPKLDLRGINSTASSFISNAEEKSISEIVPPQIPDEKTSTGDSTGHDIESAILSEKVVASAIPTYENSFISTSEHADLASVHESESNRSSSSSSVHLTAAQQLVRPSDKLRISSDLAEKLSKVNPENKPPKINMKFEAEMHLLETYRESLKQIAANNDALLEECIKNGKEVSAYATEKSQLIENRQHNSQDKSIKSSITVSSITNNRAQITPIPSIPTEKSIISTKTSSKIRSKFEESLPFVNFKRGDESGKSSSQLSKISSESRLSRKSSNIQTENERKSKESDQRKSRNDSSPIVFDSYKTNISDKNVKCLSLEMIDQQIHNEDVQLDHFKTLLKIREKALIDRTKGELAWLEITKKKLKEKGNLNQASAIKKKQRALILKLQQEKHEMQRLKLMHKASCEERKVMLNEQKNIIKKQLSTKDMLTQFKRSRTKETNKHMGPMKVYDHSILTSYDEYSVSEEVSIRTRSDVESIDYRKMITVRHKSPDIDNLKTNLAQKEEELKRRRERVESLLKWHQRLSEEEKQVAALEEEARKLTKLKEDDIIYAFPGSYLNQLWFNITKVDEKKYVENKNYFLSKIDVDHFYEKAKMEVLQKMNPQIQEMSRVEENISFISEKLESIISEHEKTLQDVMERNSGESTLSNIESIQSSIRENCSPITSKNGSDKSLSRILDFSKLETIDDKVSEPIRSSITEENITLKHSMAENEIKISNDSSKKVVLYNDKKQIEEISNSEQIEEISENVIQDTAKVENFDEIDLQDEVSVILGQTEVTNIDTSEEIDNIVSEVIEDLVSEVSKPVKESYKSFGGVSSSEENDSPRDDFIKTDCSYSPIETEKSDNSETSVINESSLLLKSEPSNLVKSASESELENSFKNESPTILNEISESKTETRTKNEFSNISKLNEISIETELQTTEKSKCVDKTELSSLSKVNDESHSKSSEVIENSIQTESSKTLTPNIENVTINGISNGIDEDISYESELLSTENQTKTDSTLEEIEVSEEVKTESSEFVMQDVSESEFNLISASELSANLVQSNYLEENKENIEKDTNELIVSEAEQLLRKQLQIELEIKELEKQQQTVPFVFVREIPNKPPPPYQPPKQAEKYNIPTNPEQVAPLLEKLSHTFYKAYTTNTLNELTTSQTGNDDESNYNRFFFDLCHEIALDGLKIENWEETPSWLHPVSKKLPNKLKSKKEVYELLEMKVNECLGFVSKMPYKENLVVCGNRKKRDHVDEILVRESQLEEIEWTNFDDDEVAVKNELTDDIFELLINDTVKEVRKVFMKKYKLKNI